MLAKFHGNILNLGENIAKSFRGATFFWLTLYIRDCVLGWAWNVHLDISPTPFLIFTAGEKVLNLASYFQPESSLRHSGFETKQDLCNLKGAYDWPVSSPEVIYVAPRTQRNRRYKIAPPQSGPWKLIESSKKTLPHIGWLCWNILAKFGVVRPTELLRSTLSWAPLSAADCRILLKFGIWVRYGFAEAVHGLKSTYMYHEIHGGVGDDPQIISL